MSLTPAAPVTWEPCPRPSADAQAAWTIDLALAAAEAMEKHARALLAEAETIRERVRGKR